jgi:hypothetical protein
MVCCAGGAAASPDAESVPGENRPLCLVFASRLLRRQQQLFKSQQSRIEIDYHRH